jgi:hypothetical protein
MMTKVLLFLTSNPFKLCRSGLSSLAAYNNVSTSWENDKE